MPYVPVGTTTTNPGLQHQASVYYVKKGLDRLMPKLYFVQLGYSVPLPLHSGKVVQMFRFNLPGINTTPAAEGVVPNPVPQSSYTISAVVEQYSDYMSSSTLYDDTDINSEGTNQMVSDLSYRGAVSADTITRIELDSNIAYQVPTLGANLSAADFKYVTALMSGANVMPYGSGDWMAVIHPFLKFDLESDNTAGGFIDAMKYTNGTAVLNGEIGKVGGCRIMMSTNVGTNGATAPNTLYYSYVFGYQAFAVIDLAGRGPSKVTDPKNERFNVKVFNPKDDAADPTHEIGTIAYYRFTYATKLTDPQRMRVILSDASII